MAEVDYEDFKQYLIRINERLFGLDDRSHQEEDLLDRNAHTLELRMHQLESSIDETNRRIAEFSSRLGELQATLAAMIERFKAIAKSDEYDQLKQRLEEIRPERLVERSRLAEIAPKAKD